MAMVAMLHVEEWVETREAVLVRLRLKLVRKWN